MIAYIVVFAAGFILGGLIAWNNSKASLKAKLDSEIGKATGAGVAALSAFKAKL